MVEPSGLLYAELKMTEAANAIVPTRRFDVSHMEAVDRYDLWRETISVCQDIETRHDAAETNFDVGMTTHVLDQIMVTRVDIGAHRQLRQKQRTATDRLDYVNLKLFMTGGACASVNGEGRIVSPGSILVQDMSQPYQVEVEKNTHLTLTIPRHQLSDVSFDVEAQHLRVLRPDHAMNNLLASQLVSLKQTNGQLSQKQAREVAPLVLGMVSACLGGEDDRNSITDGLALGFAAVSSVRRYIEQNLNDPDLTVERIAARMGLSRSRLYRLFEPLGGVAGYITERRLQQAFRTLRDPFQQDVRVIQVALEAGYSSETAFGRSFKRRFGMSPGEVCQAGQDRIETALISEQSKDNPILQVFDLTGIDT